MRTSSKSCLGQGLSKAPSSFWLFSLLLASFILPCSADQLSLAPLNASSREADWVLGPATASLGSVATVKVPAGYRFTDVAGARVLLRRSGNPAPTGLVGLLTPDSGQWWIVLSYHELGYVRYSDPNLKVDAAAVLDALRKRVQEQNTLSASRGLVQISSVDWALKPVFDPNGHSLEWSVRAVSGRDVAVNHTVRILGRHGLIDATAVQIAQTAASDPVPIRQLVRNVSFNPGERYSDYERGDKVANIGLAGLITEDTDTDTASLGPLALTGIGAGGLVLLGLFVWGGVALRRRWREMMVAEGHGSVVKARSLNGVAHGSRNGSHGRRGVRKVKVFDYHKYYSDLLLQVSSHPYVEPPAAKGVAPVAHSANGHAGPRPENTRMNQVIVQANLELIANQTNLIEEQKRLLQEQAKLIEEKSRLLREKNNLLEKQTELFERDLL